jgi:membrane-associated protease RseP (regulator of RpoE activity)
LRGGSERELTATLGKRPESKFENGSFSFNMPKLGDLPNMPKFELPYHEELPQFNMPQADVDTFVWRAGSSRQIGVSVSPLTKQLADHFAVAEGALLINTVRENSAAAKAGLRAGDIIIEVDGKSVRGDMDLIRAIGDTKNTIVQLTIVRDKTRQTISVTPEARKGGQMPYRESFQSTPEDFELLRRAFPAEPGKPLVPATPPIPFTWSDPGRIL